MSQSESKKKTGLGALGVVVSVLAAGFGVQSGKNRERDFSQGRLVTFVVAGVLFTALFVLSVFFVVTLVLDNAR